MLPYHPVHHKQIFISHAQEDKDIAGLVYNYLTGKELPCWLFEKNRTGNEDQHEVTIHALNDSNIFVLVFSKHTNNSERIRQEVERAVSEKIPVIVFRLEDVQPLGALEFFLGPATRNDAFEDPIEISFDKLYQECTSILMTTPVVPPAGKRRLFLNPFFLRGRISRGEYFISWVIFLALLYWSLFLPKYILEDDLEILSSNGVAWCILLLVSVWFISAQSVKRCHDLSKSGWYLLNPTIVFLLPFIKGMPKKNKYGTNPTKKLTHRPQLSPANKIILVFTVIVTLLYSLNIFPNAYFKEAEAPYGYRLFQTDNYYVYYPATWLVDSSKANNQKYKIYPPDLDSIGVYTEKVILLKQDYYGQGLDLNEFVRITENELKGGAIIEGSKLLSSERLAQGQEYQRIAFTATPRGYKGLSGEMYCFFKRSSAYSIVFFFDANKPERNQFSREAMVKSFTFK